MVGTRTDEREHLRAIGHSHRTEAELLEELVGERPRRTLGEPAAQLGQRRREQLQHWRLTTLPANSRHGYCLWARTAVP
jgi:hypothetical protein